MAFPPLLVLGATGRIGQVLRQTWPMQAPLRWQARRPQPGPGWHVLDPLQDPEGLVRAAEGCTAILCLAGVVPGRGGDLADNSRLAEAALRAGAAVGARVLLTSSAAVYGAQPGQLAETAPLRPANAYGAAKVDMEQRAAALAADLGGACCCLRIGNIAGLDAILGGWRPGFALDVLADGSTPRRSYIGGQTLARVLADLLACPLLPPVLNLAQPGPVAMGDLLDAAGHSWQPRPAPATAIAQVALDTGLLQALLPTPLSPADPVEMTREWAALEPHMTRPQEV